MTGSFGMASMQFWFDFASTYSYPSAMRIGGLAQSRKLAVTWRPFLLGPIFAAQGWGDSPFNLYPAKGRYMWRDLERLCAADGIALRRPSTFPRNGLLAARVANRFVAEPWVPAFCRAIFKANFAEDHDIADRAVVQACLEGLQLPGATLIAEAESAAGKGALRAAVEQAQALGIFGAPSFVVGDELFWGNDRLEAALDWAAQHGSAPTH